MTWPNLSRVDLTCPNLTCPELTYPTWLVLTKPVLNSRVLNGPVPTGPVLTVLTWPVLNYPVMTWPALTWLALTWPALTWPDLTCPDLTCPDLTHPDLTRPDLTRPDLTCPDLTCTDLTCPWLNLPWLDLPWVHQSWLTRLPFKHLIDTLQTLLTLSLTGGRGASEAPPPQHLLPKIIWNCQNPNLTLTQRLGFTWKWLYTPTHRNSKSAIYQLLLTKFWWNFKGRFLGTSRTDSNWHGTIYPGNICLGNICPYQEYFSCYWTNFDETFKVASREHLE